MRLQTIAMVVVMGLLSSVEVRADLLDGLVGYYPANGSANDESGNNNHGTFYNGASLATDFHGNANSAFSFDGADDYVSIPDSDVFDFGTGDLSLSAWFKTSSTVSSASFIVDFRQDDNVPHIEIYVYPGLGKIGTHILPDEHRLEYLADIADGKWHHVAITLANGVTNGYTLYLDGIDLGHTTTASPDLSNWDTITIGHMQPPRPSWYDAFPGLIDEVRIYNRVLSAEEIEILGIPTLRGDLNEDCVVDIFDWVVFQVAFGSPGQPEHGDLNGDGMIDIFDWMIFQPNFGKTCDDLAPAVPEPATLAILALGGVCVLRRRVSVRG